MEIADPGGGRLASEQSLVMSDSGQGAPHTLRCGAPARRNSSWPGTTRPMAHQQRLSPGAWPKTVMGHATTLVSALAIGNPVYRRGTRLPAPCARLSSLVRRPDEQAHPPFLHQDLRTTLGPDKQGGIRF